MAGTSPKRVVSQRAGAARSAGRYETTLPPLVVRYMRRMKRQRVYSYEVSWKDSRRSSGSPVVVRLIVAGAQVVPSERTLDPAEPKSKAIFYVTPLARKGWLRGERLEVLHDGRKLQEIRLPSKVVSQRLTWVLLGLAIVIPWLWLSQVEPNLELNVSNMRNVGPQAKGAAAQEGKGQPQQGMQGKPAAKGKDGQQAKGEGKNPIPDLAALREKLEASGDKGPSSDDEPLLDASKVKHVRKSDARVLRNPGDYLDDLVDEHSVPLPALVRKHAPFVDEGILKLREGIAAIIDYLYFTASNHDLEFGYCLAVVLLLLTFISWFFHRDKRKKRVGSPIPIPEDGEAAVAVT
jgi:hypothetical protein